MRKLLLGLKFDGTNYCGWQVQPNGPTVQAELCRALFDLLGKKTGVTGCSRTDSGVHAKEFFCHFEDESSIPEKSFPHALNARLPEDISVFSCREVAPDFHARYNCVKKRYIYKIFVSPVRDPFSERYALRLNNPPDIEKIKSFCQAVTGKHDFAAFSAAGRDYGSTVRTIYNCDFDFCDGIYTFSVTGDGFLYKMVRNMVGTALYVSEGKISLADLPKIISSGERALSGPTAPPHGLYLDKVYYSE